MTSIATLNLGNLSVNLGEFYALPDTHPQAGTTTEIELLSFCIIHQGRVVLIDAPAMPGPRDAHAQINAPPPLLTQLAQHQIAAAAVTDVVITHVHWDHYNGLSQEENGQFSPAFPQARHIINAADWDPAGFGELEAQTLRVVEQHGLLTLITGRVELADGLTIIPAPGETPGHQIVELKTDEQTLFFCGDLFHHPLEFADLTLNVTWAETEKMKASKQALLTLAAENGGLLYFAHIAGVYRVRQKGKRFLFHNQGSF